VKTYLRSRIPIILSIVSLLVPVNAARAGSGGSAYSIIGLGDLRTIAGGRGAGMGDAGVAVSSPLSISFLSPAAWSTIDRTRLEGAALYEGFNSTDGTRSRYLAHMDFNGALLAIPVSTGRGITFVLGFVPYSNVDYNTYTHGSSIPGPDTLSYSLNEIGSGGVTKGMLGLSWAPLPSLSIGATANYLFGTTLTGTTQTFTDGYGGTIQNERSMNGINFTGGVLLSGLGKTDSFLRGLSFGAVITTRATLNSTLRTTYSFLGETDTSAETNGRISLPYSAIFGLAYQWSEKWTFALDYAVQPWENADLGLLGGSADIRNCSRISGGFERGAERNPQAAWLDRIAYRAGISYNQTYATLQGRPINELSFTAGVTLPVSGESRLLVAAVYGTRGTTEARLIKDTIFRITVALSISDTWFVHFAEE
jgi:hypothetical protein